MEEKYLKEKEAELIREIDQLEMRGRTVSTSLELRTLKGMLTEVQSKLSKIKREKDKAHSEAVLKHNARYKDLLQLVYYLRTAGLDDLANDLEKFVYVKFSKADEAYLAEEIYLRCQQHDIYEGRKTTKKEYKEIRRSVMRLSKTATKNAKKYKDLYRLCLRAPEIVEDIKHKGISRNARLLQEYFTQPESQSRYYSKYAIPENLGYEFLAFYRDYESKYNKGVRNHRI